MPERMLQDGLLEIPERPDIGRDARPRIAEAMLFPAQLDHAVIGLMDPAHGPFVHRAWWKQFLPRLARRHVKWFAETDVSVAEDDELLTLMREAGCAEVLIGHSLRALRAASKACPAPASESRHAAVIAR